MLGLETGHLGNPTTKWFWQLCQPGRVDQVFYLVRNRGWRFEEIGMLAITCQDIRCDDGEGKLA
jgi:hypothetical protein